MALADLSKQRPSAAELEQYPELTSAETDRAAAIMASAVTEHALESAISCRLVDHGDDVRKTWFEGDNAPFGTFSSKIQLGMALGIYGKKMLGQLIALKNIRNQFAHCSAPLDFSNPAIVKAVEGLRPDHPLIGEKPIRTRYLSTCIALAKLLALDAHEQAGTTIQIRFE
jgi:hypothetical protein